MVGEAVAAFDFAALLGVAAMVRGIAGACSPSLFDSAARLLVEVDVLKMGVPTILAMYAWVRPDTGCRADPVRAFRGAAGVLLTVAAARAAQNLLPARPRPNVALPDFPFPEVHPTGRLADWSSMPSDTAALAFALATVAWASSRRVGVVAVAWAALMTCLPRIYFGFHYMSDILVGAALGVLSVTAALRAPLPAGIAGAVDARLRRADARAPALLLLLFFAFGAECLYLFQATRRTASFAGEVVRAVTGEPDLSKSALADAGSSAVSGSAAKCAASEASPSPQGAE